MSIISVEFKVSGKPEDVSLLYKLTRISPILNRQIRLSVVKNGVESVLTEKYIVSNEVATARLICANIGASASDAIDVQNILALLTQG